MPANQLGGHPVRCSALLEKSKYTLWGSFKDENPPFLQAGFPLRIIAGLTEDFCGRKDNCENLFWTRVIQYVNWKNHSGYACTYYCEQALQIKKWLDIRLLFDYISTRLQNGRIKKTEWSSPEFCSWKIKTAHRPWRDNLSGWEQPSFNRKYFQHSGYRLVAFYSIIYGNIG